MTVYGCESLLAHTNLLISPMSIIHISQPVNHFPNQTTRLLIKIRFFDLAYGVSPQSWTLVRDKNVKFIAIPEHLLALEKLFAVSRPSVDG